MKEYQFSFRKSFEHKFHGIVEAKNEKEAEKKIRKFAKKCHPGDDPDDGQANTDSMSLDEGDDFCVWNGEDV